MDGMNDDARFAPKSHSQIRSRRVPLYSHPVQSSYNPDYLVAGEEFDDQSNYDIAGNYSSGRYPHNLTEQIEGFDRYAKRQKLKNSVPNSDFVARSGNSLPFTEGNSSSDWNEHEKFVLLEVWGEKFLQLKRNSLRSEDWAMVAEKVSEAIKIDRTETQCKQMMDNLKRKYKKERAKGGISKWAYYRKMDMLMSQDYGTSTLACGVDSGEFVFMDTELYLERANGNDEMRDSPCDSEEEGDDEGDGNGEGVKGLRVLANSVEKFGRIYERIESSKREKMMELERMRSEFERDLELQKKEILERAEAEIAKLRDDDDDDEDDDEDDDDDDDGDDGGGDDDDGEFGEDVSG